MHLPVQYESYRLARVLSIYAIVSADHLIGKTQEYQIHAHTHAWELCYCIAGRISVRHNSANLLLDHGQCLLIPPGVQHNINVLQDTAEGFVISFTCMDSYLPMLRGHITDTSERQQRQFQNLAAVIRRSHPGCLPMTSGGCSICRACPCPDAPCRFPEKAMPSMEACGLLVSKVCEDSGLADALSTALFLLPL